MTVGNVSLGDVIRPAATRRASTGDYPILSMTMRHGLIDQLDKFNKRVASHDTSEYRVVTFGQLVVGFPIDEGVVAFQLRHPAGIVSPAYGIWDLVDESTVDRRYLERFLRSPRAIGYYRAKLRGSTARRRSLPRDAFLAIEIPLPPIEEQRRIAAVLDAADALRAKRREAIAKLDSLTQAIFIDMFGDPLATGAATDPLRDFVTFVGGGTPSKSVSAYFRGDICWATSKDMHSGFLSDTKDHITNDAIRSSATKLVPAGTVLVVVKSKVLARRLPVAITEVPTCFGQDLKGLIPNPGMSAEFVAAALRAAAPDLLRQARGINTEGLTLQQLRFTPIPHPRPDEVSKFTALVRRIKSDRVSWTTGQAKLDTLFASLQQRAFRGEL